MRSDFDDYFFSFHFNVLWYLGLWSNTAKVKWKRNLYTAYKIFIFFFGGIVPVLGIINFYQNWNDFKKIVFNMCTTSLSMGILIKNIHVMCHSERLDKLRLNLYKDSLNYKDPEDFEIEATFKANMITHRKIFYVAACFLWPTWLITSLSTLKWGPRELPFPAYTPVDLEDDFQFALGFLYHMIASSFVVAETLHADLALFSIMLQVAFHYSVLAKDISKINEMYATDNKWPPKTDIELRTKNVLKKCAEKQLALLGYVREIEYCYNKPMLLQLICGFLLLVGNGIELILVSVDFSMKLSYQIGYTLIIYCDVFMVCSMATLLSQQNEKVIWSLYDLAWYQMDVHIRKEIFLITKGTQMVRPLTAGKLFQLNLPTFLGLTNNVYSWLALFRQSLFIKK